MTLVMIFDNEGRFLEVPSGEARISAQRLPGKSARRFSS
jgi:hypothetical protein